MRSIYRYHTITRGWGDIGYNYIIGPCSGNIYQGRAGGWGVKGAHAGKFNAKTIGIMVMGNYQNQEVPQVAVDSITKLSKSLGEKYGFWPNGYSKFALPYTMSDDPCFDEFTYEEAGRLAY